MISVASNAHASTQWPRRDRIQPQWRTLYIRHTFEQRDQFLVFAGDPDEAGGERAGAGDFVCLGSEPAGADGLKVSDVRLAANSQHPMGIAGQREGEVGERKQRATLQDADGIQMARFDRHLRAGESGADFDDPDSILPREAVLFEKRRHALALVPFRWFHWLAPNTIRHEILAYGAGAAGFGRE